MVLLNSAPAFFLNAWKERQFPVKMLKMSGFNVRFLWGLEAVFEG